MDIKQTLRILTNSTGVSGDEFSAATAALQLLREYAPDASIDAMGNVIGRIGDECLPTLMLDAHIDQIGMIVTYIDDKGFLKIGECGGLDLRTMLAQSVTVHGIKPVQGVVSTLPPHVSPDHTKVPETGELAIDIGMSKEEAEKYISLGDRVTVNSSFRTLSDYIVSAPSIDDRSGVCAILCALDMLKGRKLRYNLAVCFSSQEEVGERGAKTAAFQIHPDEIIAVDVSFGRTPDSQPHETAELGSGTMIGISAVLDRKMSHSLINLAHAENIPYTIEVMPSSTGTNADAASIERGGARAVTLSIPIRYMHTSIETVDLRDIENTAKLICAYAGGKEDE